MSACTCPYFFTGSTSNQVCNDCTSNTNTAMNYCCNYCPTTPQNLCVPDGAPCSGGYQNSCGGGSGQNGDATINVDLSSTTKGYIFLSLGGLAVLVLCIWMCIQRRNRQWPFNCDDGSSSGRKPAYAVANASNVSLVHGEYVPPPAYPTANAPPPAYPTATAPSPMHMHVQEAGGRKDWVR